MKPYLETIRTILSEGNYIQNDRTGAGRLTIFGAKETYSLANNRLPLVTTRKLTLTWMDELFGMIKGSTKAKDLGESFWKAWTPDKEFLQAKLIESFNGNTSNEEMKKVAANVNNQLEGDIGPMYGKMWREWPLASGVGDFTWIKDFDDIPSDVQKRLGMEFDAIALLSNGRLKVTEENRRNYIQNKYVESIDQLNKIFLQLKRDPYSTHHRITAFNPSLVGPHADPRENVVEGYGALWPCHSYFQFHVPYTGVPGGTEGSRVLDSLLFMGSSDVCLGRPYNIAFYSLLTIMMAHCLGYTPGSFTIMSAHTHIYGNHIEKAKEQVLLPTLNKPVYVSFKDPSKKDLFAFTKEDIILSEYESHPPIHYKANV